MESALLEFKRVQEDSNRKLDQITDLLISNARIEEKLIEVRDTIKDHEQRLREAEKNSAGTTFFTKNLGKVIWAVVGAFISYVVYNLPKLTK